MLYLSIRLHCLKETETNILIENTNDYKVTTNH